MLVSGSSNSVTVSALGNTYDNMFDVIRTTIYIYIYIYIHIHVHTYMIYIYIYIHSVIAYYDIDYNIM